MLKKSVKKIQQKNAPRKVRFQLLYYYGRNNMIYPSNFNRNKLNIVFLHKGTKYKFDEECCKREFMKVLKDESKTQMCIGLCTPKTLGRIPTVCDDVKQIPDQMCTVEIQTKP